MGRSSLRIVLFGITGAGKTSLLGALNQSAQTQEHLLNGHLSDVGRGLAAMQRRLYEESPRETLEEVVPYPVVFEPFATPAHAADRLEAVLIDCDGRVANDLLTRRRALGAGSNGALAQELLDADAIVLAVDASASPAQVDADFAEFSRFLRLLEQNRGQRTEVGGLPVFVVLTKCDLLAQPSDGLTNWMDRIEERKRQLAVRFQEFLAKDAGDKQPFGSISLHLWATAVKRPALAGSPARPREPYGVAELFRQCFDSARDHRARRGQSGRRLFLTVAAATAAVVLMASLAVLFFLTRRDSEPSALELQVNRYKARDQELSPQARHKDVKTKIVDLRAFRKDPAFAEMPQAQKDYVDGRLKELAAFQEFEKELNTIPDPKEARDEKFLKEIDDSLAKLKLPPEYRSEWSQTEAGRRHAAWSDDVKAIDQTIQALNSSYKKALKEGKEVLADLIADKPQIPTRARKVLDDNRGLPDSSTHLNKTIPGSDRVTYVTVFGFAGVQNLLREWEDKEGLRAKLSVLANLKKP